MLRRYHAFLDFSESVDNALSGKVSPQYKRMRIKYVFTT
ncbi:hypothetical protein SA22_1017 [Salmonella enterica subsp. enterica serovar Agona str. 22.H.04]|uniref:Uncharacterized protein n=6 Tax=Salmonella enterica I TaxID=59201 RepID=B5F327_SALA4|nr:hypothetical protein SeAg_B2917 [Salmonella enterica subsp. enterica serovar Agona str. SL483]ACH75932.1 hypothetical protein SeD_A3106 [Salmonella enterica subsp. enterica serovar Dublin str. CT_02021853]ACY89801.1 hypothetical protein STM14_3382 [Salmonella enterica subsp. enterica serovar Typhimurium str. 14028S]AKD09446.1 hypothetical protein AX05_35180 [Salmonella enterica subsp. enterica serovar Typhimurium str. CDC 2011K-0870]AQU53432.1 hypothetical protein SEETMRM10607_15020 [Salmone